MSEDTPDEEEDRDEDDKSDRAEKKDRSEDDEKPRDLAFEHKKLWVSTFGNLLTAALVPLAVVIYQGCAKQQQALRAQTDKAQQRESDARKEQDEWSRQEQQRKIDLKVSLAARVFAASDADRKQNCDLALSTWALAYPDDGDKLAPIASACGNVQAAAPTPPDDWAILMGETLDATSACRDAAYVREKVSASDNTGRVVLYQVRGSQRYLTVVAGYPSRSDAQLVAIDLRSRVRPGTVERLTQITTTSTFHQCQ